MKLDNWEIELYGKLTQHSISVSLDYTLIRCVLFSADIQVAFPTLFLYECLFNSFKQRLSA